MHGVKKSYFTFKSVALTLFLLVIVAVGMVYIQKPQELRKKAALSGATLSMSPATIVQPAGSEFNVGVILESGPDSVTGAELHFEFDPQLLQIISFTPGRLLPVILTPFIVESGSATVLIGAQPNTPLRGADIVGTLKVRILTDKPATITFAKSTLVSALEKPLNTLVQASGLTVTTSTPPESNSCTNSKNGSSCTLGSCPTCAPGTACPKIACKLKTGVCESGQCVDIPSPITCGGITGKACPSGSSCYYADGSTRAPYPDASGTCGPTGTTPPPHNWCAGPNGARCSYDCNNCNGKLCTKMACPTTIGTCQNNQCIPATVTQPPSSCTDKANGTACTRCRPCFGVACPAVCIQQQATCLDGQCTGPIITPLNQSLEFRVKLAGVTDNKAEGAKITVKFIKSDNTGLPLNQDLILTHIGNGIYKATTVLSNPFLAGERYTVRVKGEKHVSVKFCQTSGQTTRCAADAYITMPSPVPTSIVYDLTGISLPAGDLPAQNGAADMDDAKKLFDILSKLRSSLTAQDYIVADLNYDKWIDSQDALLLGKTLTTRYDE